MRSAVTVSRRKCEHCAGILKFDPASQFLICDHCGTTLQPGRQDAIRPWSRKAPIAEHPIARWDDVRFHLQSEHDAAIRCSGCGALHMPDRPGIAAVCSFCQSPLNAAQHETVEHAKVQGVLPFGVTKTEAQRAITETISGTNGLPGSIRRLQTNPPPLEGVYLPCFTFDAELSGSYVAEIRQNKSFERINGTAHATVDDAIIPVADHAGIASSVCERMQLSFSPNALRQMSGDFLAGFHVTLPVFGAHAARGLAENVFRRRFMTAALFDRTNAFSNIGGIGRIVEVDFTVSDIKARLILMPFWLAHYKHKDAWLTIAVDGTSGQVGIEHPGHGDSPWLIAVGALGLVFAYLALAQSD